MVLLLRVGYVSVHGSVCVRVFCLFKYLGDLVKGRRGHKITDPWQNRIVDHRFCPLTSHSGATASNSTPMPPPFPHPVPCYFPPCLLSGPRALNL